MFHDSNYFYNLLTCYGNAKIEFSARQNFNPLDQKLTVFITKNENSKYIILEGSNEVEILREALTSSDAS